MKPFIERLQRHEGGATAAEYALLASLIAATIVGVVTALGLEVTQLFDAVAPPWG